MGRRKIRFFGVHQLRGRMHDFDIAIIGAGPSGCASALALATSGLRVLLVDKATFPRDKICGDAIPGPTFKAFDAISPTWGAAVRAFANQAPIHASRGFASSGTAITFDWKMYTSNSKRRDFDNFLLQLVATETKTTIWQQRRLQHVRNSADGVVCDFGEGTAVRVGLVIGCDGANSVVGRQLAQHPGQKGATCVAVRAYYRGIAGVQPGVNEFHFIKALIPGYFWIFPLEEGWANVGFGLLSGSKQALAAAQNLRTSLPTLTRTLPELAARFQDAEQMDEVKGFALPLATQKRKISGERFLLCGDAAALVDPLWGHGIDNAVWSGLLAAQQASSSFASNNFSAAFMQAYDVAVYQKVGKHFGKSTAVLQLVNRFPWLFTAFLKIGYHEKLIKGFARLLRLT